MARAFENLAKTARLGETFHFHRPRPAGEVPRYVGIMDALVHLSLREGLPRALPQALAAAKPVVAYDCDGAREVCLDGETGFLVRPGDLTSFDKTDCSSSPAILRCAKDLASPASTLSAKISPSKKWWTPFTIFT